MYIQLSPILYQAGIWRQAADKPAILISLFFLLRPKMNAKPQANPSVPGCSSSRLLLWEDISIATGNSLWSGHLIEGFTLLFPHSTTKQSSSSVSDQTKELLPFRTDSWITAPWCACVCDLAVHSGNAKVTCHLCHYLLSLKRQHNRTQPGHSEVKLALYLKFIKASLQLIYNPVSCSIPKSYTHAEEC